MLRKLYRKGLNPKVIRICILQSFRRDIRQRLRVGPTLVRTWVLVDKTYPSLDDEARQQLALQRYLFQLDNEQVAFSVKQRKPKTIEAAVSITLECESFLIKSTSASAGAVVPVRVESNDSILLEMMTQLMARLD